MLYFLEADDVRICTHRNGPELDIYIQSSITVKKNNDIDDGTYSTMSMILYKVSEEIESSKTLIQKEINTKKQLLPRT